MPHLMSLSALLALLAVPCVFGCGDQASRPPLGYVSGTVTNNGKPVESVIVNFQPDSGRTSRGVTNAKGYYEVEYVLGEKGTKIGPTAVSLEWPLGFPAPFAVPPAFSPLEKQTMLDVKKGNQTFDIKLEVETKDSEEKPAVVD